MDSAALIQEEPDMKILTPRELAACVTPLFELPGRFQKQALNELVIRCEVADRLLAQTETKPR